MAKTTLKKKTRRGKKKSPRLFSRWMVQTGRFAARHPSWVAGPMVFGVVFSFVSANALWYQPGPHPGPLLKTRAPSNPYQVPGQRPQTDEQTYETFRIERDEDTLTGSVERSRSERQDTEADLVAILKSVQENPPVPELSTQSTPVTDGPDVMVAEPIQDEAAVLIAVQKQLAELGYYSGKADGLTGPLTRNAIKKFQADHNLPQTGQADQGLLTVLKSSGPKAAPPVPSPRPEASDKTHETVVAVLSTADADETTAENPVASPMIVEIQRGLVNIAYDDVTVDGVVGTQTREAIQQFQKHYRLPVTGEPSVAVLDKLKEIGAL